MHFGCLVPMARSAPTSTQLSEPWRASLQRGYDESRRGSPLPNSLSTKPCKSKGFHKKSRKFPRDRTGEEFIFEEGMFETSFLFDNIEHGGEGQGGRGRPKSARIPEGVQEEGLVPEAWRCMQQDLHMTRREKRTQLLRKQRENAQLNELQDELCRQRIDLLSEAEESACAQSLARNNQLLTPRGGKLERDLSVKGPDPHFPDKERGDEIFTFLEKGFLKRTIPDFSQVHCGTWPILHILASSGQYFFLDRLLNLGLEVDEEDEDGLTPLQRAVQARRETAVSQLLHAGANVDVLDRDGANLLHLSALVHSLHLVKLFLIHGVQVNHVDKHGWTPLHVAALTGKDDVVRHLVLSGAKQSMKNEDGMIPMDIAIALGKGLNSTKVARTLLRLYDVDLMV